VVHIFRARERAPEQMFNHAVPCPVFFFGQRLNFPKQLVGKADGDLGKVVIVVLVHTSIFVKKARKINGI
jgi:hypothetical protein